MTDALAAVAFVVGLLVALTPSPMVWFRAGENTVELWWSCAPSVCWAVALLGLKAGERLDILRTRPARLGAVVTVVVALGVGLLWPDVRVLAASVAGFSLVIVALSSSDLRFARRLAPFGKHSYGVYLAHVIFVGLCRSALGQLGVSDSTLLFALGTTAIAFAGSLALTMALAQSPRTAWMVG